MLNSGYNLLESTDYESIARLRGEYIGGSNTNLHFALSNRKNLKWGENFLIALDCISFPSIDPTNIHIKLFNQDYWFLANYINILPEYETDKRYVWMLCSQDSIGGNYSISINGIESNITINTGSILDTLNLTNSTDYTQLKDQVIIYGGVTNEVIGDASILLKRNTTNKNFNEVINVKLVSSGNYNDTIQFGNLKFYKNNNTNSFFKCTNVNKDIIQKINSGNINLKDIYFELVSENNYSIIQGLTYKSLIKTDEINESIIFEYSTQTGTKLLILSTESYDSFSDHLHFYPELNNNLLLINSTDDLVPAIDYNLLSSSHFYDSLMIKNDFPNSSSATELLSEMLNKGMITDSIIKKENCYYCTNYIPDNEDLSNSITDLGTKFNLMNLEDINYYITRNITLAKKYDIKNLYITVNYFNDFDKGDVKYSIFKDGSDIQAGRAKTDLQELLLTNHEDFAIREMLLFDVENDSYKIIYYSRFKGSQIQNELNFKIFI